MESIDKGRSERKSEGRRQDVRGFRKQKCQGRLAESLAPIDGLAVSHGADASAALKSNWIID